jgi:hypothetical protein
MDTREGVERAPDPMSVDDDDDTEADTDGDNDTDDDDVDDAAPNQEPEPEPSIDITTWAVSMDARGTVENARPAAETAVGVGGATTTTAAMDIIGLPPPTRSTDDDDDAAADADGATHSDAPEAPTPAVAAADITIPVRRPWPELLAEIRGCAARTGGWTHALADSERLLLTDRRTALRVYASADLFYANRTPIRERRLGHYARLRIQVTLGHERNYDGFTMQFLYRNVVPSVLGFLEAHLPPRAGGAGAPACPLKDGPVACFVLFPEQLPGVATFRTIWLHFPGITLATRFLTHLAEAVDNNKVPGLPRHDAPPPPTTTAAAAAAADTDIAHKYEVLSLQACHFLYGCDPDRMTMAGVITVRDGAPHRSYEREWNKSLRSPDVAANLYHNDGRSWTAAPPPTDDDALARLPLLLSINPMGTPVTVLHLRPPGAAVDDAGADDAEVEGSAAPLNVNAPTDEAARRALSQIVALALESLRTARAADYRASREVGSLIHAITDGAEWAKESWMRWCCKAEETTAGTEAALSEEFYLEWVSFADRDIGAGDPVQALCGMVFADAGNEKFKAFSDKVVAYRNRNRPPMARDGNRDGHNNDDIFRLWGGMGHWSIAQYLVVRLHGTMVCVNSRSGLWFVYRHDHHRWEMDDCGMEALLRCSQLLHTELDAMRTSVCEDILRSQPNTASTKAALRSHEAATRRTQQMPDGYTDVLDGAEPMPAPPPVDAGAPPPPPPEPEPEPRRGGPRNTSTNVGHIANFGHLAGGDDLMARRLTVVQLDRQLGDFRNLQNIVKLLGNSLGNKDFHLKMDTVNEHILPFANGVLDLDSMEFRNGRPSDMVMKGPTYAFCDYDADDSRVQDVERMLSQTFPDRTVMEFFLTFGASLLRRRNRFKHFYILTGGTNAGKSQILNIIKQGLGTLWPPLRPTCGDGTAPPWDAAHPGHHGARALRVRPDRLPRAHAGHGPLRVPRARQQHAAAPQRPRQGHDERLRHAGRPRDVRPGEGDDDHLEAGHGVQQPPELHGPGPRHRGPLRLHPVRRHLLQEREGRPAGSRGPVPAAQVPGPLRPHRDQDRGDCQAIGLPLLRPLPEGGHVAPRVRPHRPRAHAPRARPTAVGGPHVPRLHPFLRAADGELDDRRQRGSAPHVRHDPAAPPARRVRRHPRRLRRMVRTGGEHRPPRCRVAQAPRRRPDELPRRRVPRLGALSVRPHDAPHRRVRRRGDPEMARGLRHGRDQRYSLDFDRGRLGDHVRVVHHLAARLPVLRKVPPARRASAGVDRTHAAPQWRGQGRRFE